MIYAGILSFFVCTALFKRRLTASVLSLSAYWTLCYRNKDFQEVTLEKDGVVLLCFASTYGFRNIQNLVQKLKRGKSPYHFVEVMACPSGKVKAVQCLRNDADSALLDSSHGRTQVVWMVVANWRPYLVRTQRSFSRKWRWSTRQSAPCCQKRTTAWLSCTSRGSTVSERREPRSCCAPSTTLWRRWKTGSLWSGDDLSVAVGDRETGYCCIFLHWTKEPSKYRRLSLLTEVFKCASNIFWLFVVRTSFTVLMFFNRTANVVRLPVKGNGTPGIARIHVGEKQLFMSRNDKSN